MASKQTEYYTGETTLNNYINYIKAQMTGHIKVSIDEMWTASKPTVLESGSVIEFDGALYTFESDETIIGTPSDGDCYIYAVLNDSDLPVIEFSNDAPAWISERQGWYYEDSNDLKRALFRMEKDTADYVNKRKLTTEAVGI